MFVADFTIPFARQHTTGLPKKSLVSDLATGVLPLGLAGIFGVKGMAL